jgi:hypothetical protein
MGKLIVVLTTKVLPLLVVVTEIVSIINKTKNSGRLPNEN